MRFMMIMYPGDYEDVPSDDQLRNDAHMKAMGKFNDALRDAGVLLAVDGLRPPAMGARVSFKSGKPVVVDGPFSEAKEVVGGYWMIQARSRDEAIEWAKRCPGLPNETIEVRPVWEFETRALGTAA
jgi:hypothetical protein